MTAVFGLFGEGDLGEVRQMGARLAHRGPLQVTWSVNSRVHLGSRGRSRTTQVAGLPLAFSGFFDNRPELLATLGIGADQAASITDAELFLALYRRYGEEGLGGIRGQFAVALWDATRQRLLLLCDPLATKLLYVARAGDRWAFATEYKSLLALGDVPARPDRNAIHHLHCTKQPYARGSLLEGVRPLLPGTCMELGGPEPVTRCYRPDPSPRRRGAAGGGLDQVVRAELLEAAAEAGLPAREDRGHGRAHVVVDAAPAGAAGEAEGGLVGGEVHLLGLARVRRGPGQAAWQSRTWATLTWPVTPASQRDLVAPVELEGLAGREASGMKTGCAPAPRSAIQRRA